MEIFTQEDRAAWADKSATDLIANERFIKAELESIQRAYFMSEPDMQIMATRAAILTANLVCIKWELQVRTRCVVGSAAPTDAEAYAALIAENHAAIDAASALLARKEAAKEALNEHVHRVIKGEKSIVKLTWAIHPHPGGENWHVSLVAPMRKYIAKPIGAHGMWRAECWIGTECLWSSGSDCATVWKARQAAQEHFAGVQNG